MYFRKALDQMFTKAPAQYWAPSRRGKTENGALKKRSHPCLCETKTLYGTRMNMSYQVCACFHI